MPRSIALCREAAVDELWLLTSSDVETFPGVDRVFSRLPIDETPAVYRSCDVLVKLSYVEGMFGPPLEIFHCGGTAVVYEVTGHDEYIVDGENALVAGRDDEAQVVRHLERLREDRDELARLKRGALATAAGWPGWREAAAVFAQALTSIAAGAPASRRYLRQWADTLEAHKKKYWHLSELERFASREQAEGGAEYDRHNFVQIYHKAEGSPVDPDRAQYFHYLSDEPATITAALEITGLPFWIRIDPSVRIGVIFVGLIEVRNRTSGDVVIRLSEPEDFDAIYLDGTIRRLGWRRKAAFFSYGIDPWFYLPQITAGAIGDALELTMQLREIGVTQFANRFLAGAAPPEKAGGGGLKARLSRLLKKRP